MNFNLLIAYPYLKSGQMVARFRKLSRDPRVRIFIDSGAFTAWKGGKEVTIDEYCRFIDGLGFEPHGYFSLDKIGDPKGSMENYQTFLRRGYKPIPIFTRGEDPSVLDDYFKTSEIVGIGGLVKTQGNMGFVKGIQNFVEGRKVHWLGFTQPGFVARYKPYSVDSASWASSAISAVINLYLGRGRFVRIGKKDFERPPSKEIQDRIRYYGFDPLELRVERGWNHAYSVSRKLAMISQLDYAQDFEKHFKTKIFTVISGCEDQVDYACEGFEKLSKTKIDS